MKRVLIAQTSFLGDLVLTTPLFFELRRRFPKAEIAALVTPRGAPLLEGHPAIDRVLTDDKRGNDRGVAGLLRTARRLRLEGFDTALAVHRSLRTALCLWLAGIPRRYGFRESPGRFLYTETARRDPSRHDVERNLCLLRVFGIEPEECERRLGLGLTEEAVRRAEVLLGEVAPGPGPLCGIAPGSVWATKRWIPEGFAAVARGLARDHGARVVVLGGAEDRELAERIVSASAGAAKSLAGRTDLPTLAAIVSRLDLLVSNDSAPLHLASAFGVPRVAVFCATSPSQGFGPWGGRAVVVERDLDCRPCGRHGGPTCPRGTFDCIELVSEREVLAAASSLLGPP
jgi:heptosyltransferase-2